MSESNKVLSRQDLLAQIEANWNALQAYLASLSDEQMTGPTDAAGWTAKDHVIHVAKWEEATIALFNGKSKREAMNVPPDVWAQGDDPINAVIQQRYRDMPLAEVLLTLNDNHERMLAALASVTDDALLLPYSHYQRDSTDDRPLMLYLPWETAYHYRDHLPWIAAIVENA